MPEVLSCDTTHDGEIRLAQTVRAYAHRTLIEHMHVTPGIREHQARMDVILEAAVIGPLGIHGEDLALDQLDALVFAEDSVGDHPQQLVDAEPPTLGDRAEPIECGRAIQHDRMPSTPTTRRRSQRL